MRALANAENTRSAIAYALGDPSNTRRHATKHIRALSRRIATCPRGGTPALLEKAQPDPNLAKHLRDAHSADDVEALVDLFTPLPRHGFMMTAVALWGRRTRKSPSSLPAGRP
jgi:hypothetical protein